MEQKHIILIEDDELYLKVLEMHLSAADYSVKALHDGRQMRDLITHDHTDLIILDIGLPFIDGFELIAAVRKLNSELPVLAMSAQSIANIESVAMNAGADRFLHKPFDTKELIANVEHLIANGRSQKKVAV